ncbi:Hypothetical protein NTJ_11327 [Nesidiocoris tenuis]|uniref:Partial AB-hydrolase lipase domain-containing protein n=1 Tax=Nesidiocoris tenuis TaxID=355587 RepID=A0ABN7B6V4_9HEMI|nr:Hypothetical protein NTJ_11327 [Nesidiocoris tenuis]
MNSLTAFGVLVVFGVNLATSDAAVMRKDNLYGPRYRPLWEKGAKTQFTKNFSPTSLKSMTEKAGFIYENFKLTTEDGYLINLNRIINPDSVNKKDKGFPLLLMNGFMMHSDAWVVQKEMDSNIAFVFAALGYDVWLGDQRGTIRSTGHVNMSSDAHNQKYWDHAFDEISVYDTSAFIDFILVQTGYRKLNFMCISLGCTFHAVLISERPQYNDKILAAFYFVPLVNNIARVMDMPVTLQLNFLIGEINTVSYEDQGIYVIAPRLSGIKKEIYHGCIPFAGVAVSLVKQSLHGALHFPPETVCHLSALSIGGGSTKTAKQILQVYKEANFAKFDYGRKRNMELYGQEAPPFYNVSRITSFVAIYYSDADGFSTVEVRGK